MSGVTTVRLGALEGAARERAAAVGLGLSTWLKELAERDLAAAGGAEAMQSDAKKAAPSDAVSAGEGVYRAWFDAQDTAKLDALVAREEYRSRAAALRALLDGVGAVGGGEGEGLSAVLRALVESNDTLVYVSRDLANMVKLMQGRSSGAGQIPVAWRLEVESAVKAARDHVVTAGKLIERLAPLAKTPSEDEAK